MLKKMFANLMTIACIALVLWIGASFIDVNLHNFEKNPAYASWNMFNELADYLG